MAMGIVFALAYVFLLRTPPTVPTPEILAIRGTYVIERSLAAHQPGATPRPLASGSFSASSSGDASGTLRPDPSPSRHSDPRPLVSTYSAKPRTALTTSTFLGRTVTTRTIGEWPPVWQVPTPSPLAYQGLAAIVRSAVEDGDRAIGIKPLKDGERTVWRAAMTLDGEDVQVVVDRLTGIVVWHTDDRSTFTATVDWDSPPAAGEAYAAEIPAGQAVATKDESSGYASSPAEAGAAAGYAPLVSELAPDGYALRAVATWESNVAPGLQPIYDGQSGPIDPLAGELQVGQLFTRGLSWFTLQQLGPGAAVKSVALLRDRLASIATDKLSFQKSTLQYGALSGATAYTWYDTTGPTLFASDARHIVSITGALTRRELIAFAEGLKPAGSGGSAAPSPDPSPSPSP
jgi:ethanolamine utilization microcompartment shell protein EutS